MKSEAWIRAKLDELKKYSQYPQFTDAAAGSVEEKAKYMKLGKMDILETILEEY